MRCRLGNGWRESSEGRLVKGPATLRVPKSTRRTRRELFISGVPSVDRMVREDCGRTIPKASPLIVWMLWSQTAKRYPNDQMLFQGEVGAGLLDLSVQTTTLP